MRRVNWAEWRTWRDPEAERLALEMFPDLTAFAPSPDQMDLDLGDMLPLQTGSARTERSEGGRGRSGAGRNA